MCNRPYVSLTALAVFLPLAGCASSARNGSEDAGRPSDSSEAIHAEASAEDVDASAAAQSATGEFDIADSGSSGVDPDTERADASLSNPEQSSSEWDASSVANESTAKNGSSQGNLPMDAGKPESSADTPYFDSGLFDPGLFDPGLFDPGLFDSGSFDSGATPAADSGQPSDPFLHTTAPPGHILEGLTNEFLGLPAVQRISPFSQLIADGDDHYVVLSPALAGVHYLLRYNSDWEVEWRIPILGPDNVAYAATAIGVSSVGVIYVTGEHYVSAYRNGSAEQIFAHDLQADDFDMDAGSPWQADALGISPQGEARIFAESAMWNIGSDGQTSIAAFATPLAAADVPWLAIDAQGTSYWAASSSGSAQIVSSTGAADPAALPSLQVLGPASVLYDPPTHSLFVRGTRELVRSTTMGEVVWRRENTGQLVVPEHSEVEVKIWWPTSDDAAIDPHAPANPGLQQALVGDSVLAAGRVTVEFVHFDGSPSEAAGSFFLGKWHKDGSTEWLRVFSGVGWVSPQAIVPHRDGRISLAWNDEASGWAVGLGADGRSKLAPADYDAHDRVTTMCDLYLAAQQPTELSVDAGETPVATRTVDPTEALQACPFWSTEGLTPLAQTEGFQQPSFEIGWTIEPTSGDEIIVTHVQRSSACGAAGCPSTVYINRGAKLTQWLPVTITAFGYPNGQFAMLGLSPEGSGVVGHWYTLQQDLDGNWQLVAGETYTPQP